MRKRKRRLAFAIFITGFIVVIVFVGFYLAFSIFSVIQDETFIESEPVFLEEIIEPDETQNSLISQILQNKIDETENENIEDVTEDEEEEVEEPPHPFTLYSHFVSRNMDEYLRFSEENPDMPIDEVLWKVNVFLHLPFFEKIVILEGDTPLLVNPSHRLPDGFVPSNLTSLPNGLLATQEAVDAFLNFREAARADGLDFAVVSAYRDAELQAQLFSTNPHSNSIARPSHSEHQTGRALDLWGPAGLLDYYEPSVEGIWARENAWEHGFIIRYTEENTHITSIIPEPWHITYVGKDIAQKMREQNIGSLEEFVGRNPNIISWVY